jgi:hypothetical protein
VYFSKFPIISYKGVVCRDITRRVKLSDSTLRQPLAFYPFELSNEHRPDTIAFDYYDDPNVEWVVLLSNGIIDPYYGWYLTEDDFQAYIQKKYGSVEESQETIKFWRNNWSEQDLNITPEYFASLPDPLKKYWTPRYGAGTRIISYQRRREDWTMATNWIIQHELTSQVGSFDTGERITYEALGVIQGSGQVVASSNTTIDIQHVLGINTGTITGIASGATAEISTTTTLSQAITPDERVYWEPVYVWDWEREKNEANKFIQILDKNYFGQLNEEMRRKLSS